MPSVTCGWRGRKADRHGSRWSDQLLSRQCCKLVSVRTSVVQAAQNRTGPMHCAISVVRISRIATPYSFSGNASSLGNGRLDFHPFAAFSRFLKLSRSRQFLSKRFTWYMAEGSRKCHARSRIWSGLHKAYNYPCRTVRYYQIEPCLGKHNNKSCKFLNFR